METTSLGAGQELDLSLIGLFMKADIVVQLTMLLLVAASFWAWAIIVQKLIDYRRARAAAAEFDAAFWSGQPLDELFDRLGPEPATPSARVFAAGMAEWRRSHRNDGGLIPGARARIDRSMDVAIAREAQVHATGLTFLASVGSASPFIGLFGTVWGIMRAFTDIAQAQNTNLAVVAPGIAEALMATALGLLAAIPAVIFYNKFTNDSDRIVEGYEAFADEFSTILSRQLGD
ncbi:MAG: protein TolQ [Alkalilacustris sp.]